MSEGYVPSMPSIPFVDELGSVFDVTTERVYANLPEVYRLVDAQQTIPSAGQPLKRWLRGICGVLDDVEVLIARLNYLDPEERLPGQLIQEWTQYQRRIDPVGAAPIGQTSDLVDPVAADNAWLDWLAQLVGASMDNLISESERRDAVENAISGFKTGTKTAIANAAKSALTGTQYIQVFDHSADSAAIGAATQWDVLIITKGSETPDVPAVLDAVSRKNAKPAGVVLHHNTFETSWADIEAAFPTWADIEAAGSWQAIEEAGL